VFLPEVPVSSGGGDVGDCRAERYEEGQRWREWMEAFSAAGFAIRGGGTSVRSTTNAEGLAVAPLRRHRSDLCPPVRPVKVTGQTFAGVN
jgi:hypothetical protein